jgi:UDP-glucose:(heptosyl)LPS alpha-1,3-glucosyltransferase
MNIAFCYENVLPARGGCETYIADLARRLTADGHALHLYASRWDATRLPEQMQYHRIEVPAGPRFLRPWRFGGACAQALRANRHDVSIGFDKTWGQDVLYPQGGLHSASAEYNVRKHSQPWMRFLARAVKRFDLAHWSFSRLERRQYVSSPRPLIVVNSNMVQRHFAQHYGIGADSVRVVRAAIDPNRFIENDRLRRRLEERKRWGVAPKAVVALFAAMNYRLKGLEPLLHAIKQLGNEPSFRLLVIGSPKTGGWERLARKLGVADRVIFGGYCGEMRNAYFAADFLVHPTFYDPCSLVVLEALACGLPVITSRYNGASELLSPPTDGYVIDDPHDGERLAGCMKKFLDPDRRRAAGTAARRTAAGWTFEHHYRQMLEVLHEAATHREAA